MKKIIVLLCFLFISLVFSIHYFEKVAGQSVVAPPIEWTKTYGGAGSQGASIVQQTSDGGYVLFGTSGLNGWLVKVDSTGKMQWNKTFSKSGYEVKIHGGQQTNDGGFMLAGGIPNTEIIDGTGTGDAILFKTDSAGNIQWERTYGGSGHQFFFSAQQTSDGGYVLAGTIAPSGINNDDFYLIKTDSEGNITWSRTFGEESANEIAWSVQQTPDGGYILAGGKGPFSASGTDAWLVKTDTNGNMVWNKIYGEPTRDDWIYSVQTTTDGGYIMAGCHNRNPERSSESGDFWLMKTDNAGNVQWSRQFGEYTRYESANSVQQTIDGGFIAVGQASTGEYPSGIWLVKTDSSGGMVWNRTFEGGGSTVIQTNDRGYAVAGASPWISVEDGIDMLLIKMMRANPPVSIFDYSPLTPTVQEDILFDASASYDLDEDILSYDWDFGDSNSSSTQNSIISHSFELPGNYTVLLTVVDSEDLNSSYSASIIVKINSAISISSSSAASYACKSIEFAGTLIDANGNGLSYENVTLYYGVAGKEVWTPITNATTDSAGNFVSTWTPINPSDYSVKVEWRGNQTFYGTTNLTSIQILPNPTHLSISLSSSSTQFGFKIGINGELTSNEVGLAGFPIRLSYSVTEGQTWNDISLITTDSEGKYSVEWLPSATGVYIVKALWAGNSSYPRTEVTANLAVLSFEEQTVFSVASNSTVSGLAFNSTSKELRFNLSGVTGTTGYVDVCISETLINNINEVQAYVNGIQSEYESISLEDSWLLHFEYNHSTHEIIISLGGASTPFEIPNGNILPVLLVLTVIIFCIIMIYFVYRKR